MNGNSYRLSNYFIWTVIPEYLNEFFVYIKMFVFFYDSDSVIRIFY